MLVSTKGRYALRVMMDLAQTEKNGCTSLKVISEKEGISLKYLESIVSLLNKGGLVVSSRGKAGGYALARPAERISVYDVIRLTENSLDPVSCMEGNCGESCRCVMIPMWEKVEKMIEEYLSGISIRALSQGKLSEADDSIPLFPCPQNKKRA